MAADTIDEVVAPISVRDLVRAQLGLDDDPWELALVQRDLVWKQDRMVGLLDSLLAGYPIGSLLLCRVEQETDVRQLGTGQGKERRVAAGTPQLVDGQQRVYALFSIFTGKGHGRFHLSLTKDWDRSLNYIEWRPRVEEADADDEPRADDEEPIPPDYVDLSKWANVADEVCDTLAETTLAKIVAILTNGLALPSKPFTANPRMPLGHLPEHPDKLRCLSRPWRRHAEEDFDVGLGLINLRTNLRSGLGEIRSDVVDAEDN